MTTPDELSADQTSRMARLVPPQAAVLVVAGLDPSGGAGLLADARVVTQHGFHAVGVATALTEQDSIQCAWMHPVPAEVVSSQLARLIDDFEVRAVKVGMLATAEVVQAAAQALRRLADSRVPIVVDPVLRATRGVPLLDLGGRSPLDALAPILEIATLVTPNADELAALTGGEIVDQELLSERARRLRALGPRAVLAKGGHMPTSREVVDLLVDAEGELSFRGRRVEGPTPHGTGCALSSEIACRLAFGASLREAVLAATERVRVRIAEARVVGRGRLFLG